MSSPADLTRQSTVEDLRRIIRRIEQARPFRPAPEPVEEAVGGVLEETPDGPVLVVRRDYPLSHRHGRLALGDVGTVAPPLLDLICREDEVPPATGRLLFLDTETTGLAGGTGTYAFLVGVGWVDGDRFVVAQYFMRDLDQEPALLAALHPLLEAAGGLVTFNGTAFDVPLLETRFLMARRRWPAVTAHVDLLRPARRVWSACLDDCRLGTLEREVLGLERDGDVPGALIPGLYFDFLRTRRAAPLARVFDHNRDDVLSLAALLGWFARVVDGDPDLAVTPADVAGIGRLWERMDPERAASCYQAALAAGLEGVLAHRVRLRLARWEKRRARWEAACALWEAAARAAIFDPLPWEELAKFHEHRRRDFVAARAVVHEALALARAAATPARVVEAFSYRLARLERRLVIGRRSFHPAD